MHLVSNFVSLERDKISLEKMAMRSIQTKEKKLCTFLKARLNSIDFFRETVFCFAVVIFKACKPTYQLHLVSIFRAGSPW